MRARLLSWAVVWLAGIVLAPAATRVALMDFSTDDNSYRSAQVAVDFAGLVQAQLTDEPGVEWVERSQLDRAQKELELSGAGLSGGDSPIKRGKWAKADWLITGAFSLDDRSRRTLFLEVIDLQHADVLAAKTLTFAQPGTTRPQIETNQLGAASSVLRQLLSEARGRQQAMAGRILVAQLFLADISSSLVPRSAPGFGGLEQGFEDALQRVIVTNRQVQLIHFPKAYRSLEESELVLDGFVEAPPESREQIADLYVWGTYAATRKMVAGKPLETVLEITLNLWDGASPPTTLREELSGAATPAQFEAAMQKLARQVVNAAHKRGTQREVAGVRQGVAQSLVATYDQMTLQYHFRQDLGLEDPAKFLQAAHMLEAACLFDPDNQNARLLYLTCRWGRWMDFSFKVKNLFWSKWRRSQAWGYYAERFGLKQVEAQLPFPYQQPDGISLAYLGSIDDVCKMFPQWHSAEEMALETQWQRQGVHTSLMEAEFHGFPKEMPHELAMKWKTEAEAERWKRLTKVAGVLVEGWEPPAKAPSSLPGMVLGRLLEQDQPAAARLALLEKIWLTCAKQAQKSGKQWVVGGGQLAEEREQLIIDLCAKVGQPARGEQLLAMLSTNQPAAAATSARGALTPAVTSNDPSRMVPTPTWVKDLSPASSWFRLFPPSALPVEVKPAMESFQFPSQFEVKTVVQMDFWQKTLLMLAMDERSRPSSDGKPEVTTEMLAERFRLWSLEPGAASPVLFQPDVFPQSLQAFLLKGDILWFAGKPTGSLDLKTGKVRRLGLSDGFTLGTSSAFGCAGGRIFAAGDNFKLSVSDPAANLWNNLPLPPTRLSGGTDFPTLLAGQKDVICYLAGSVLFHDVSRASWTNGPDLNAIQNVAADEKGFWFGGFDGLHYFDPASRQSKHWTAPASTYGLINALMGIVLASGSELPQGSLDDLDDPVAGFIKGLQKTHAQAREMNRSGRRPAEPLHLDWRIPGRVTALANDGEFLWFGVQNYFGNYLLVAHKPSDSLVAYSRTQSNGSISSLGVSDAFVWVGTAYSDRHLLRIPRDSFLAVPRNRWVSVAVSEPERAQLIQGMSVRDQAMYAYYAGEDSRVVELLGNLSPDKATLEEMFILACCCGAPGVDKPQMARAWCERLSSRYPDSPWSRAAQEALRAD